MPINLRRVETYRRRKEQRLTTSYQSFPEQPHAHSCLLIFKDFNYQPIMTPSDKAKDKNNFGNQLRPDFVQAFNGRTSGATLRNTNAIELPFPKNLQDNTGLRVNGFERGPFQEQIASKLNEFIEGKGKLTARDIPKLIQGAGAAARGGLDSLFTGGGSDIIESLLGTDIKKVASAAQYLLRNTQLFSGLTKSIDLVTGQTINPRETLAFEGVNLRTHNFSWELFPNSPGDSQRIKNITNMIKRKSLPEVGNLTGIPKAFLEYPSVVEVYLLGIQSDHWIKYKSSMITEMQVDYGAAGGVSIMKGGKPGAVQLSMTMSELEIETAHDYGAEVNADDSNDNEAITKGILDARREAPRNNIISASAG